MSLAGYRLLAGDGAGPGRWRALWQGTAADVLAPGARFVVGEAQVVPAPDRVATLGLENGPDAVRLSAPDGAVRTVGYGALTYSEYFEGTPAPDVDAGYSLARMPDSASSGDNARDFAALTPPTPGAANRPERDVALVAGAGSEPPGAVAPGEPWRVAGMLVNRGAGALRSSEARVLLWAARAPDLPPLGEEKGSAGDLGSDSLVAESAPGVGLEAGDSVAVALSWAPEEAGVYRLSLAARIEDDGLAGNDRLECYARAGVGPLVVSEVMYPPRPGQPEWIEVRARGQTVDLARFHLEDATGRAARLDSRPFALLEPDSLAILTDDVDAFLAAHAGTRARVFACAPWPALNNTASERGAPADRVRLLDERDCVSDELSYAGGGPAGYSLERRDTNTMGERADNWGVSALDGGTPLAANSLLVAP